MRRPVPWRIALSFPMERTRGAKETGMKKNSSASNTGKRNAQIGGTDDRLELFREQGFDAATMRSIRGACQRCNRRRVLRLRLSVFSFPVPHKTRAKSPYVVDAHPLGPRRHGFGRQRLAMDRRIPGPPHPRCCPARRQLLSASVISLIETGKPPEQQVVSGGLP
jgi:hypothetical protein